MCIRDRRLSLSVWASIATQASMFRPFSSAVPEARSIFVFASTLSLGFRLTSIRRSSSDQMARASGERTGAGEGRADHRDVRGQGDALTFRFGLWVLAFDPDLC